MITNTNGNANLDAVRKDLITWTQEIDNGFGKKGFEELLRKVNIAAAGLSNANMTLHVYKFKYDFDFCFGELQGTEKEEAKRKYVPISYQEYLLMRWQKEKQCFINWPVNDPNTDTYFIPTVTENIIDKENELTHTHQFLTPALGKAEVDPKSEEFRILETLHPYSFMIGQVCGPLTYKKFVKLFPSYPINF